MVTHVTSVVVWFCPRPPLGNDAMQEVCVERQEKMGSGPGSVSFALVGGWILVGGW